MTPLLIDSDPFPFLSSFALIGRHIIPSGQQYMYDPIKSPSNLLDSSSGLEIAVKAITTIPRYYFGDATGCDGDALFSKQREEGKGREREEREAVRQSEIGLVRWDGWSWLLGRCSGRQVRALQFLASSCRLSRQARLGTAISSFVERAGSALSRQTWLSTAISSFVESRRARGEVGDSSREMDGSRKCVGNWWDI